MADAQNTHKLFSYSKRNEETENKSQDNKHQQKKTKNGIGIHHTKPKYILHPYKEESPGAKLIIIEPKSTSTPSNNDHMTRPKRARSAGTHHKSKIKMKKPKKHRFYLKNKNKLHLAPSDSDRTNTTTNYKKSYRASQRAKRFTQQKNLIHISNNDSIKSTGSSNTDECQSPQPLVIQSSVTDDNINVLDDKNNNSRASLSLRSTQSNPSKPSPKPSYSSSELMSLGIGGDIFTDYNIKSIKINGNNQLIYKDNIINIPSINNKRLVEWTCLEVSAWILSIGSNGGAYNNYIKLFISNNINGKALMSLTFVNIMKLTKYEINVNDCTNLLKEIEILKYVKPDLNSNKINHSNEKKQIKQLKLGMVESSDDIDIPLFRGDNDSNQIQIEQGRFWRLFYCPKQKLYEYCVDKPVNKWTPYEVSLWINNIFDGKFNNYSNYFIQYQIDGESLLNITRKSATNYLKMISPNIRRLFFDELRALSTLKPCNIRQHNNIYTAANDKQIKRITHRFTQNDIPIRKSMSFLFDDDGINDKVVAQKAHKIVKGMHKKNARTSPIVIADLTPRKNNNTMHNFVSDEEDNDNETITMHCQHLTKDEIDFYNDTNLHFVAEEYENKKENNKPLMDPNNKPAPSVGALFNARDVNALSDEFNIDEINNTLNEIQAAPLSIGTITNINMTPQTSIGTNQSNISNATKIEKDSSNCTNTNTETLSSPSIKSKSINENSNKKEMRNTFLINLTTHENKTSLLVEASLDSNDSNSKNNSRRRISDNRNIHNSFEQYSNSQSDLNIDDINAPFQISDDVNDEQDDLEIDIWEEKNKTNKTQQTHCIIDSFMDAIDDPNDPLFNESLSPVSISIYKYNNNKKQSINKSISFPFDDIEEKMNQLNQQSVQLYHEPNLTLELNQPISDETDEINDNNNNNYNENVTDIYT